MAISHKAMYPEQYTHSLVGKRVNIVTCTGYRACGTVTRIVDSRFGKLAILDDKAKEAYSIDDVVSAV